ncbi:hypothetical protein LCGC14_0141790 [marine sediment metagenome]|uniref:Uncharacterized protein n=1 Tax=marine sediment metagenome TaxID=412755 RepID=A0A0F9V4M1_9ZZZZ
MERRRTLDVFMERFATKIAYLYPSCCADKDDYIQAGHLKLAEISGGQYEHRDFISYAIAAVARTMRDTAMDAMFAASAPHGTKRLALKIEMLLAMGKTELEICDELQISQKRFMDLQSLIDLSFLDKLLNEPSVELESFNVLNDILSSNQLTEEDRIFIRACIDETVERLGVNRKQQWLKTKSLKPKLIRSGYGD